MTANTQGLEPAEAGPTVADLIRAQARRHPEAIAVSDGDVELTYGELARRAAGVRAAVRAYGAGPGRPVAVLASPGADLVVALVGALGSGAPMVCLAGTGTAHAALADLGPACVLTDSDPDDPVRRAVDATGVPVLDLAGIPGATDTTVSAVAPDSTAYVAYTSGTTGRPKGIRQTHAALAQFTGWFAAEFGIGAGTRLAQWAAPGYDACLVEVFAALRGGATLCPVPWRIRADPDRLVPWLSRERVTVLQTVPSFARELEPLLAGDPASTRLAALLLAGEALPGPLARQLRARLPQTRLVNLYGPTETILATWHEVSVADTGTGTVAIGRPIPGRDLLVLDDRDRPCPPGEIGHLVIRSRYVTTGYVGAAAADNGVFHPPAGGDGVTPHYRTGDLGRWRPDGVLEFHGRRDLQIKMYGVRIELADVEAALSADEGVAACAVVPVTGNDGLVVRLDAYVVPGPGGTPDHWRSALRRRFGDPVLPVTFTTVDSLPRNTGGKVDRRALAGLRTGRTKHRDPMECAL
ncbi:amino acid adenylation domain-containing protein [Micromonospora sp. NPDC049049]|uniref:amino acid adenylation domain-containing protein n=1 Tax=Micromonospora sp. NPDC049049 TaxID=3155495 RepID=UPI0033CDE69D